jgi:signal transduction histidine kinase
MVSPVAPVIAMRMARGSGLIGLRDRVEALGGSIEISGPPGDGTLIVVSLPAQLG